RGAGQRMRKTQAARVQRLASETLQRDPQLVARRRRQARPPAVDGVAEQRRADVRHVHANLVRASRLELDLAMRVGAKSLDAARVRASLAPSGSDGHLGSLAPVTRDRGVDAAAAREHALADRLIRAADLAPFES